MKVKKGDKVYPFITGDDVIITKGINHPGKTVDDAFVEVDETLDKHQKEIDKLKSNLKYVYSYGGVGGKGSGGSGGGSAGTAALFISLGGHQLQNGGNPIILNEPGNYVLEGNVSNSGGETYYVSVTVGNKEVPIPALSIEKNKCRFSTSVNLPRNGEISVMFYAPDGETALAAIHQNYIVNPHTFDVKFKYEFESGGKTQEGEFDNSNEYFIGDTAHKNPFIDISFKIDIPNVSNVSVKYSIGDTTNGQGVEQFDTTDISNNHFKIHLDDLIRNGKKFTDESNTGTYNVSVTLNYTVNAETVVSTTSFKITLIPNYLYINVRNPQELLYDTLEDLLDAIDNGVNGIPEKNLNVGVYTSFYCKIYEGTIRTTRQQYPLTFKSYDMYDDDSDSETPEVFKDDPSIVENRTGIVEQVETSRPISVAFETPGIKKLEFVTLGQKTTVHDNEKPVVKYIYVKESDADIDWYPANLQQQTFYFRANSGENTFSPDFPTSAFSGTSPLELSETGRPITLSNERWYHPNTGYDTTIISFGLQYSAVNNDGAEILRTYEGNSNVPDIVLYSNKLFSDVGKKICIPTESNFDKSVNEQYHLIQIVRYKIGLDSSNNPQYASYLYIDGKLESNKPGTDNNQLFVGRIVFNNVNAIYNHIGIQYVKLDEPSVAASSNDSNTIDAVVYQYYLAYKDIMHVGTVTEAEREILKTLSDIKFDGENVIVEKAFLDSTSPYMPIPTMMMEYEGQKLPDGTPDTADLNKFISDLFRGYPTGDTAFGRREISLYWCEGKKEGTKTTLNKVEVPSIIDGSSNITYTGNWMVELQGTSTMRNRIKNFSLIVNTRNSGGDKVLLMSPNYDKNNPKTFLPESVWTIKADIADSAHANNTSIGKFVNEVCTPFSQSNGMNLSGNAAAYVKNTLEGFPVLMYFKIGESVYYLGVYNFNMGRQSYYNLGYHTSKDMTDMINNIMPSDDAPFSFSIGSGEIVTTLAIGEVQDNFAEFDFHQYDDSVLFQPDDSSITRMFGKDEKITGANKGNAKVTLSNFVKSVSRAGAYCFASIGKSPKKSKADDSDKCINRYDISSYFDEENKEHFIEYVPDISWQMKYSGTDRIWTEDTSMSFTNIGRDIDNLLKCIYTVDKDNNTVSPYLDFSSISEYYTICMAFGMIDSILKNMNIKSWDGHKCYVAFYDMDCALEENNAGGEDVSYLAATDYWHSEFSRGYVEPVTVNYDYWNSDIGKGFDFSSSYLFAIAKYAQAIFNKLDNKITLSNFPQQFWAKLRQPKTETSNGGALQDAKYFINNYFSSGIGKIPAYLASLNYQVKYLYKGTIIDDEGRETEVRPLANESAFNGTRLEKVKDWLNKRLHFLDVVFNVQGIGLPIGGGYTTPSAERTLLSELSQNNDVIVLSDMFSTENSKTIIMGSNALPVNVYAPMNTPFIINRGSSNEIYLLCAGTDNPNPISITATQSEPYRFLGSKEFTNLSMVEPFLTNAYMINSNKIEEIVYGGMTVPPVTASFNIVSTSVKKILFNIPTFGGTLNINSTGLNGQAVHTLNISRTGFSCDLRNLSNLKTLNIASVNNPSGSITVAECPIVGENCIISGIEGYNPTTLNTLTMSGVSGKFDIRDTNIQTINFSTNPDKEGEFSINGDTKLKNLSLSGFKKIAIRNCPNIDKLVIENPEKCIELIIDIPETSERIDTLDGFNNTYKQYNSETGKEENVTYPYVFDFTAFTNLKTLSLSGSEAEVIKIPNKKVSILTFRDNKNLEFVDTAEENSVIELTQDSTFFNCPCYGMRQSWWSEDRGTATRPKTYPISDLIGDGQKGVGNLTKMCVSETCESLANTFYKPINTFPTKYPIGNPYRNVWGQDVYNQAITQSEARRFIDDYVGGQKIDEEHIIEREKNIFDISGDNNRKYGEDYRANITSLYGCFYNQKGIFYTGSPDFEIPDLSEYISLNNISSMYYGTNIQKITSNLLSLPDVNNTNEGDDLNMDNILGISDLSITKDAFKHVSYRIRNFTNMSLSIYGADYDYTTLVNENVNTDGYFDIVEILCPKLKENAQSETDYEPFTRLTSFSNFSVKSNQWIDYSNLFKVCPNVSSLIGFLNCDLSKSKIDGMLKDCKNLVTIDTSFNHTGDTGFLTNETTHAIDLYEFFNWEDPDVYSKITSLFVSSSSSNMMNIGFSVKKEISNEHFFDILGVLHNYQGIKKLSNLFSYCTIKGYDESEIKLEGDMNDVWSISSLFYKCKSDNDTPLRIRRSFFEHLKNVTVMTNTFYGVWFDHMLSYDFFCKQLTEDEITMETVYLDPQGSTTGTLKSVKYRNALIDDMSYCFCGAKFYKCDNWFNPNDESEIDGSGNYRLIPFDDIVNDDSTIKEYYKKEGGIYVKYTISTNHAYSDTFNNFTNYVDTVKISGMSETWQLNNHTIDKDLIIYKNTIESAGPYTVNEYNIYPTYCCLPPDLFYGCNYDCNLSNVFADSNIIGVIPQHLLKKCYNSKLENMFKNVNILPNLIYHYNSNTNDAGYLSLISNIEIDNNTITITNEDDTRYYNLVGSVPDDAVVLFRNGNGELRRRYPIDGEEYNKSQFAYVPQGYTTNQNLNSAFTFRYNLPAQVDLNSADLAAAGITWAPGSYDSTYSPDGLHPELWPYHTQYFFMTEESVSWNRLIYMSYPFISDEQDTDFSTGQTRMFSSDNENYKNKWWSDYENVIPSRWDSQTNGLLNVFLNLCGKRNIRTGKISDNGCTIKKSMNNHPQLSSFISGTLVVLLNGKVFDDGLDAGLLTNLNASSNIIQYTIGFGRNIILPQINYTMPDASQHPKILLQFNSDNSLFYEYMFVNDFSLNNYKSIFTSLNNKVQSGKFKYIVR